MGGICKEIHRNRHFYFNISPLSLWFRYPSVPVWPWSPICQIFHFSRFHFDFGDWGELISEWVSDGKLWRSCPILSTPIRSDQSLPITGMRIIAPSASTHSTTHTEKSLDILQEDIHILNPFNNYYHLLVQSFSFCLSSVTLDWRTISIHNRGNRRPIQRTRWVMSLVSKSGHQSLHLRRPRNKRNLLRQ